MNFEQEYARYKNLVEDYLAFPELKNVPLGNVMLYSLGAGGKRVRPILALAFCEAYGGDIQKALPVAAAVEMIHTSTLIQDDLPCMDDDALRRGKPSCHIAFSESDAVLAASALMFYALEKVSESKLSPSAANAVITTLCALTGAKGVIGGQKLDLLYERNPETAEALTAERILSMYGMKTCTLLQACCVSGYLTALSEDITGADDIRTVAEYAYKLGLAFQITDDILDETGNEKKLGKPVKSDIKNKKRTYVSVAGLEKAREDAARLTEEAVDLLENIPNSAFLKLLTKYLLIRNN